MNEYVGTLDPSLSYYSHKSNDTHSLVPNFYWYMENSGTNIHLKFPLLVDRQSLHYRRGSTDANLNRTKFRFGNIQMDITRTLNKKQYEKTKKLISGLFLYELKTEAPDLVNMVDIRDDRNPLDIKLGNPSLRTAARHQIKAQLTLQNQNTYFSQTYTVLSDTYQNCSST